MIKGFDRNGCSELSCSLEKQRKECCIFRDFSCNTLFGMEAKSERREYSRYSQEAAFQIEGNC